MVSIFFEALGEYNFLQQALITAILVGISSGIIGSFVVLRGMSLMGDAISHAVLPGVAISYMLGINFLIGSTVFGILAALGIGFITERSPLKNDAAIGIILSSFLALGMILVTIAKSSTNLYHILFGNILAVQRTDLWVTLVVTLLVIVLVSLFYKQLAVSTFDEIIAKSYGVNTKVIHYFLMVLLTLVTVVALQTVGVILVVAMLIIPASTAYLLTNKLGQMIFLAVTIGVLSAVVGLYVSFVNNLASGPCIVMCAAVCFVVAFLMSKKSSIRRIKS
ncbi:manganese ABC transporter permease [Brochothrix campestris FSL F6-1037]|uniref:Manganese transport system membrane protein MntC n=1 Tax=Brochothrix campestris FSL F6-1037 TaxID=1265861 RepID=W7CP43_9LIST|nr:manganese ABC transporter permease [Brochothrix campestris FSL F6-1037]